MNKPSKMQQKFFALAHPDKVRKPKDPSRAKAALQQILASSTIPAGNFHRSETAHSANHELPSIEAVRANEAKAYKAFTGESLFKDEESEEVRAAKKGRRGENCNRTACQRPYAWFRNCGTDKHYCMECTVDIGGFALRTRQDAMDLYPTFDKDMADFEERLTYLETTPDFKSGPRLRHDIEWTKRQWAHAREVYKTNNPQRA